MAHPHNWICCKKIFKILHNEKGQYVDESNNNGLYQKNFSDDKWTIFGSKMAHPHNYGLAQRFF